MLVGTGRESASIFVWPSVSLITDYIILVFFVTEELPVAVTCTALYRTFDKKFPCLLEKFVNVVVLSGRKVGFINHNIELCILLFFNSLYQSIEMTLAEL